MKAKKKVLSILMALAMAFCIATPAFAVDSVTITFPADTAAHTYKIYQILTGTPNGTTLSDAKWGKNVASAKGSEGAAVGTGDLDDLTAKATEGAHTDTSQLAVIDQFVDTTSTEYASVTTSASEDKTVSVVPGYYYIVQTDSPDSTVDGDVKSRTIVLVANDVTVTYKKDAPTPVKKVQDYNDSETESTGANPTSWQDSADYDINDTVPFRLSTTIPTNYDDYTTYKLVFNDTQSKGLTFNESSVVVKVTNSGSDPVTLSKDTDYTLTSSVDATTGVTTFSVTFSDLKSVSSVQAGSVISVEYNSTLNENAVIGAAGNPNTLKLEYSNNPDDTDSTTTSPEDKVTVFTFELDVNKIHKVDNVDTPLAGAGFTLYKYDADSTATDKWVAVKTIAPDAATAASDTDTTKSKYVFSGLDDGKYKLVESTTPAGYNTMKDLVFVITANHQILNNDPSLTALNITDENGDALSDFTAKVTEGTTNPTGVIETNVLNTRGAGLPETGATGTTIMLLFGSVLAAGAVVVMVTRKKMSAYQD